jgi:hypothetical protein
MKDMIPETEQSATKIFIVGTSACHPIDLFCLPKYFIFPRFLKLLTNSQELKEIDIFLDRRQPVPDFKLIKPPQQSLQQVKDYTLPAQRQGQDKHSPNIT